MFTIDDKKYLNLPEKVEANAEDISDLKTSLDTKQDSGTAVNDTNLKTKIEALDTLALKSASTKELTNSGDLTNAGNITNTGTLDQEGKATFGGDAEVDGTVTLNSPTDVKFKTGSLDFTELTNFMSVYNREAYQYKFAGASLAYGEEGYNTFNPSYSLHNFHKATSLLGLFSRADITGITDIEFPDMDATLPDYIQMRALADYATANNDFNITLGSGSYNFQYMFWSADKETTFKQHLKKFMVADGKTAYVQNAGGAFQYCTGLTEIGAFDLSACIDLGAAFIACTSLKSIHCTHFKVKFDISASTQFEESDLVEIIGNLDTVTTAQTLTMGATNLAKLTQDEILVATGKGWTLA